MGKIKKRGHPLLTVIYPFLDASEDVKDAFTYLHNQVGIQKENIAVIVVDDGSSDDTLDQVKAHKSLLADYSSVKTLQHEHRKGLAKTRLDGAKAAQSTFVTFLDKKSRPDPDYLEAMISKNRNIVIGNPYMIKSRGSWGRVLALVRKKIYYPYFNNDFDDIELDRKAYEGFKNKGGGGSMFVRRDYFLKASGAIPTGIHVNDDSLLVLKLTEFEPVLKTSSAKLEYMNRQGFKENVVHLYNRGPKFVDLYAKPGSRYFIPIVVLVLMFIINVALLFIRPLILVEELVLCLGLFVVTSLYLSEEVKDFLPTLFILPIALVCFSAGVLKGIILKLTKRY